MQPQPILQVGWEIERRGTGWPAILPGRQQGGLCIQTLSATPSRPPRHETSRPATVSPNSTAAISRATTEMADVRAKAAAGNPADAVEREASLSRLARKTTEAKARGTKHWIGRGCKPPNGKKLRKDLKGERKALASRYYQLLSGRAAFRKIPSSSSARPGHRGGKNCGRASGSL